MGSGISSHATRQTASSTASSETFVGKSLASVLSDTGGTNVDENGRLEYPENVHAVLDVERYVVDENGLRCVAYFTFYSVFRPHRRSVIYASEAKCALHVSAIFAGRSRFTGSSVLTR